MVEVDPTTEINHMPQTDQPLSLTSLRQSNQPVPNLLAEQYRLEDSELPLLYQTRSPSNQLHIRARVLISLQMWDSNILINAKAMNHGFQNIRENLSHSYQHTLLTIDLISFGAWETIIILGHFFQTKWCTQTQYRHVGNNISFHVCSVFLHHTDNQELSVNESQSAPSLNSQSMCNQSQLGLILGSWSCSKQHSILVYL